jgi:hypothetical protein
MQSFSLAGSAFLAIRIACPLALGVSQFGVSSHSKTFTGQTEMQIPSAMQTLKSAATVFPVNSKLPGRLNRSSNLVTYVVLNYR